MGDLMGCIDFYSLLTGLVISLRDSGLELD